MEDERLFGYRLMTSHSNTPAGPQHHVKSHLRKYVHLRTESGHNEGTGGSKASIKRAAFPSPLAIQAIAPIPPRLLDLPDTAAYLGVSEWTVRDLESAGVLPRVRVPLPNHKELRKILFDVQDLDRLIDTWKEQNSLR